MSNTVKSYFGRITAHPGQLLTGGVGQRVSSRFADRADAVAWVRAATEDDSKRPGVIKYREVCPSLDEPEIPATDKAIFTLFGETLIAVHRTDPREGTPVTEFNIVESYFVDRSRGDVDEDKVRDICNVFNDSRNEIETVRVVGDRTLYRVEAKHVLAVTQSDKLPDLTDDDRKAAAKDPTCVLCDAGEIHEH